MLYLTTPSTPQVREIMRTGTIGAMLNPGDRKRPALLAGITFAVDNGCFKRWQPYRWLAQLGNIDPIADRCLFVVAPDVVADFDGTLERSRPWFAPIRALGFRPAFVAQDGLDLNRVPWDEFDVWFTGGSDAWKLCDQAWAAAEEARRRGKWCHLGRVNSERRLRAAAVGCRLGGHYDSADGTFIAFGPDVNLPRVLGWVESLDRRPALWGGGA